MLLKRPAVVDIRMGYSGLQELRLNGIDYTERYYAQHGAATGEGAVSEETEEQAGEEESGDAADNGKEKQGVEKLMHSIPAGVLIGAGILGAMLLNND